MNLLRQSDWLLLTAALAVSAAGLISMAGFSGTGAFAERQLMWLFLALTAYGVASTFDTRFLRRTWVVITLYTGAIALLLLLFPFGTTFGGARGWFDLGFFALQPVDIAKFALIIVLAKYFSRRHIEISHVRHIIVSGVYAGLIMALLFFQPDFGSVAIVACIWLGMVLVAGIPLRYLVSLFALAAVSGALLWNFGFAEYQKERILTFLHPLADIQGAGYNAFQSTIAVGSGGLWGKGVGYGTQSRLQFLPEHETDFIFASFAEEWGLFGVLLLFTLFGIIIYRLIDNAQNGETNFESLFSIGVAVLILVHALIHIGSNIGLIPVTGTTLPFMSYGGTHLIIGYTLLGLVNAMRRYRKEARSTEANEVVGIT